MTPSPKPEDRLFETGCVFCASHHGGTGMTVMDLCVKDWYGVGKSCTACYECWDRLGKSYEAMDLEVERRRSLAANPKPAVGMYGTQPSELPETLPAGTRFSCDGTSLEFSFTDTAHLDGSDRPGYHGPYICDGRHTPSGLAWPRNIDWSTVPKPASHPSEKPEEKPLEVKADPYAKHLGEEQADGDVNVTNLGNKSKREERLAALSASTNPLDRQAAKRAALTLDFDRPSRPRRDKMGREMVSWTGWVSTFNARDSK